MCTDLTTCTYDLLELFKPRTLSHTTACTCGSRLSEVMTAGTMAAIGAHARGTFSFIRRRSVISNFGGVAGIIPHREMRCMPSIITVCNFNNIIPPTSCTSCQVSCIHNQNPLYSGRRYLTESTQPTPGETDDGTSAAPVKISMDELLALASCQPTALSLEEMYRYAPKRGAKKKQQGGKGYVDIDRLRSK